jgi:FMN-dependent NADH-azoreductase
VPETEVRTIDLFDEELPEFGKDAALAKFAPIFGEERTTEQEQVWARVLAEIERFDSADKILLSSPMWNYSVPYKLKHYLDLLMQPLVTFGYNPETMEHFGMLRNRPVQFILTRSSVPPGDFRDFQLPYLKFAFDCMGLRDVSLLTAWRTTQPTAELREQYVANFEDEAREAARLFATKPS